MRIDKSGVILIASLWILAILSILAMGIGFRISIEVRLSKYSMDKVKALYFAKAGIQKMQYIASKDNKAYDSIRDCGLIIPLGKDPENVFTDRSGDTAFSISYNEEGIAHYGMIDEERKININTASQAVLENLFVGANQYIAASIINWRSTAQVLNGAWDDYYDSLTPPYECKHEAFSVIEELLLVKDMTPEIFESIRDYITVYGDGKVNINTATKRVMLTVGLSDTAAQTMIMLRNGIDRTAGTKDDLIFSGDLAGQIESLNLNISIDDKARLSENYFTTRSNYFRIESNGMVDRSKISAKIVCVFKRGNKKLEYYREY